MYIHHSCVEAEIYEILVIPITYFLDFRSSVWDLPAVGYPLVSAQGDFTAAA